MLTAMHPRYVVVFGPPVHSNSVARNINGCMESLADGGFDPDFFIHPKRYYLHGWMKPLLGLALDHPKITTSYDVSSTRVDEHSHDVLTHKVLSNSQPPLCKTDRFASLYKQRGAVGVYALMLTS